MSCSVIILYRYCKLNLVEVIIIAKITIEYLYYVPQPIRFINNFENFFFFITQCDSRLVKMLCYKEKVLINMNYVGLQTYFQTS